ncbi:hypothetical protein FA13DRAFT_1791516 [Coprinellus micaceus]|uniref:Uncharacterized protein n=1 Tax=Coprinellus micaceus TaxID=71717 RepID=A0A4Y7TAM3_COPMI|nr:hypothetical protein FA13DRAFT_1791516 [Coprinellus micaceus]
MSQQSTNSAVSSSAMFAQRLNGGLYAEVANKLKALRTTFLGNAIFNKDFSPSIIEWSKNQMYRGLDHNEFRCNIFGQLASATDGTAIGAAGSFRFEGPNGQFEPVRDTTKVKDRFVLQCPTAAPENLANMFFNQIATLNDARDFDENVEKAERKDPFVYEQWTKCSVSEPSDEPADMLCINLGPKYTVPSNNKRSQSSSPPKKRLRRQDDNPQRESTASVARIEPPSPAKEVERVPGPVPPAAQVGDLYDPATQRDYTGPGFELEEAKLVQRDVRDIQGRLVHPKNYHDVLRPGSLLLINATLHCFIMPPNDRNKRERKFYQINAHSVRVVAVSDLEPECPPVQTTSGSRRNIKNGDGSASTQAYEDFTLVNASPLTSAGTPSTPGPSSQPSTSSTPSCSNPSSSTLEDTASADAAHEEGEVLDLPLEYVEEVIPSAKGKKPSTRRNANGKRGRGDTDDMEFD